MLTPPDSSVPAAVAPAPERFTYQHLRPDELEPFRAFTYTAFIEAAGKKPDAVVAIGAFLYGLFPAGLALGTVRARKQTLVGEILSLCVSPDCRAAGVERELLALVEVAFRARACSKLLFVYAVETHGHLAAVLTAGGWTPPAPRFALHTMSLDRMLTGNPLLTRDILPAGFTYFPLAELDANDSDGFMAGPGADERPSEVFFNPYRSLATLEPAVSVGARCGNELAGWVIATRSRPDLIAYTGLFVRRPWRHTPLAAALMGEALRRQQQAGVPRLSCMIRHDTTAMQTMFRRRFAHSVLTTRHSVCSEKDCS